MLRCAPERHRGLDSSAEDPGKDFFFFNGQLMYTIWDYHLLFWWFHLYVILAMHIHFHPGTRQCYTVTEWLHRNSLEIGVLFDGCCWRTVWGSVFIHLLNTTQSFPASAGINNCVRKLLSHMFVSCPSTLPLLFLPFCSIISWFTFICKTLIYSWGVYPCNVCTPSMDVATLFITSSVL